MFYLFGKRLVRLVIIVSSSTKGANPSQSRQSPFLSFSEDVGMSSCTIQGKKANLRIFYIDQ